MRREGTAGVCRTIRRVAQTEEFEEQGRGYFENDFGRGQKAIWHPVKQMDSFLTRSRPDISFQKTAEGTDLKSDSPAPVTPKRLRDGASQILAMGAQATEWRKRVAHGASRGEKCAIAKSPVRGDRTPVQEDFFSPLRGSNANTPPHG